MGIQKSVIADIVTRAMAHNVSGPRGNVISLVVSQTTGADKTFGVEGTVTETLTPLVPEPFVNAISGRAVELGGGALWWSDLMMTVSRDSIDSDLAADEGIEFDINGDRYKVLAFRPGATAFEYTIRRQTDDPDVP